LTCLAWEALPVAYATPRIALGIGSSNIDLTNVNNQLLTALKNWKISEEESWSDRNIIKFGFGQDTYHDTVYDYNGHRQ
jgi:hypothetical protein